MEIMDKVRPTFKMKVSDLLYVLKYTSSVISKTTNPVLEATKFTIKDNILTALATDLHQAVQITEDIEYDGEPISFAVNNNILLQIIKTLPEEEDCTIKLSQNELFISVGKTKLSLQLLDISEFPEISFDTDSLQPLIVDTQELLVGLKSVIPFASGNTSLINAQLHSVLFDNIGDHLVLVTTDKYRLALYNLPIKEGKLDSSMLISLDSIKSIKQIIEMGDFDEIKIYSKDNIHIIDAEYSGLKYRFQTLDYEFPNYKAIIPTDFKSEFELNTNDIDTVFKRLNYIVDKVEDVFDFIIKDNTLTFKAQSQMFGELEETYEFLNKVKSEDAELKFSPKFFKDAINNILSDTFIIKVGENTKPTMIKDKNDKQTYIIMPKIA
jgi:DNA polymerase-3 subunit beta